MDAELKAKWVKALRSGKYKQGAGNLYDGGKYCCLGVLCRVAGGKVREDAIWLNGDRLLYLLNEEMEKKSGIKADQEIRLANMNDGNGCEKYTFRQIADYIEANL